MLDKSLNYLIPNKVDDLIRLGNNRDAGYVVPSSSIKNCDFLISFGMAENFSMERDFLKLHKTLKQKLSSKNIYFDEVQYCPYHPKAKIKKYKKITSLRKPGNKMIKNITSKWLINKHKSFMIGDKLSDQKCALKSKLKFEYAREDFFKQVKKIVNQ